MRQRGVAGFTLVELLVVIGIVAILASLLLAGITTAKNSAHNAKCKSNLRQIGLAQMLYVGDYDGYPLHDYSLMKDSFWFEQLKPYGVNYRYGNRESPKGNYYRGGLTL